MASIATRRGLDPPSAAPRPAPRTFERGRRAKILQNEPTFILRDSRGCPPDFLVYTINMSTKRLDVPAGVPRHFAAPPAANTRRRDAGASRGKLRDERHAVLRVHGGRILRHKRAAAGARSGGTRIDESRRVAIPTRANNTNTPNPPHASHPQGRNDVRDAKADVTDVRAPGKTQRVRRKNRAFDLEAENEVRLLRRFFALFFVRFRLLGG